MSYEIKIKVDSRQAAAKIKKFGREAGVSFDKVTGKVKKTTAATEKYRIANTGITRQLGALRNKLLVVGFAFAGITATLGKLVSLAANTQEALNLVKQTFGDAADLIIRKSKDAATAVNLSTGAFLALSGEVGSLIKSFGFGVEASAKFTNQIISLSADIASFKNARPEEVFIAIRAGLVGSSEPLLRFGSDVREANLRMRALAAGIIDTNRALTSQERVMAVLTEVMRSNADAIGDIERTRKDLTVGSKELAANFKTLGENIGETLIPATNAMVQLLNAILNFNKIKIENKSATEFIDLQLQALAAQEEFLISGIAIAKEFKPVLAALSESGELDIKRLHEVRALLQETLGLRKAAAEIDKLEQTNQSVIDRTAEFERTRQQNRFILTSADLLKVKRGEVFEVGEDLIRQQDVLNVSAKEFGSIWDLIPSKAAELLPLQMEIAILNERAAETAKRQKEEIVQLNQVMGRFNQNLISAVLHGQDLGRALKSAAISFALSFLPGGSFVRNVSSFAHGTSSAPGGLALVGERGPEIVNLPRGSQVIPNNEINNINNTSTVNIILPNVTNVDKFTLRNEIIPLINEIVEEGGLLKASNV